MIHLHHEDIALLIESSYEKLEDWALEAYRLLHGGKVQLPEETFLFTPSGPQGRFISMSCVIEDLCAGTKWISSFPKNVDQGLPRGSSIVAINDINNGRLQASFDGALITRYRTVCAAVAVLRQLRSGIEKENLCIIGCGELHRTFMEYWMRRVGIPKTVTLFDIRDRQSQSFKAFLESLGPPGQSPTVTIMKSVEDAMAGQSLVSIATSAGRSHIHHLEQFSPGALVVHLSLRDLAVPCVKGQLNFTDNVNHVVAHSTTLHRAIESNEMARGEIVEFGRLISGEMFVADPRLKILHPFGLACLDVLYAYKLLQYR